MVNKKRLRQAIDEAIHEVSDRLSLLEGQIASIDEVAPVPSETEDQRLYLEMLKVRELEERIRDMERIHAEELAGAASGDTERFRQIIERRDHELSQERIKIADMSSRLEEIGVAHVGTVSALTKATDELDQLKYNTLPAIRDEADHLRMTVTSYELSLDFYANGHADRGERARRALGRKDDPAFQEYVKPENVVPS